MQTPTESHRVTNKIRELRAIRGGMTQQDLASKVGVSRQTLNAIELGKYSPSLDTAFRIAASLATPLGEVFSYVVASGD